MRRKDDRYYKGEQVDIKKLPDRQLLIFNIKIFYCTFFLRWF